MENCIFRFLSRPRGDQDPTLPVKLYPRSASLLIIVRIIHVSVFTIIRKNMIRTEQLSKYFTTRKGQQPIRAVQDLTLEVREGEVFGFLGPNGAGKTTTVRMLTSLIR